MTRLKKQTDTWDPQAAKEQFQAEQKKEASERQKRPSPKTGSQSS